MNKAKYLPQILVYGIFFTVLGLAAVSNHGPLGTYYGSVAAVALDPAGSIPALILGALLTRPRHLFPALLLLTILLSWFIYERNLDWLGHGRFDLETLFVRFTAFSLWALLTNAFRIYRTNKAVTIGLLNRADVPLHVAYGQSPLVTLTLTKLSRFVIAMVALQVVLISFAFMGEWQASYYLEEILLEGDFHRFDKVWFFFIPTYVIAIPFITRWINRGI